MNKGIQQVGQKNLDKLQLDAEENERLRMNLNMHDEDENVNFFFNTILKDSYIPPHIHRDKHEYFYIHEGVCVLLEFDDSGNIINKVLLSRDKETSDTAVFSHKVLKNTWHTIIVLSNEATIIEAKTGPYNPNTAKEFASFAPSQEDKANVKYLEFLKKSI